MEVHPPDLTHPDIPETAMLVLLACGSVPAVPTPGSPIGLGLLFTHPDLDALTSPADRAGEPMGLTLLFTRTS